MTDHDNLPVLLTTAECAVALRCSAPTVRRLVARGDLPALRVGNRIRVDASVIEARREQKAARA